MQQLSIQADIASDDAVDAGGAVQAGQGRVGK